MKEYTRHGYISLSIGYLGKILKYFEYFKDE